MTNVIPMFAFNDQQLRATIIDGEPWFHAGDACRILGVSLTSGTTMALKGLDPDERRTVRHTDVPKNFLGAKCYHTNFVSRPGLFKLIQRSNKPEAKAFDRWVRHEVLPQIMDNGGYMTRPGPRHARRPLPARRPQPPPVAWGGPRLLHLVRQAGEGLQFRRGRGLPRSLP